MNHAKVDPSWSVLAYLLVWFAAIAITALLASLETILRFSDLLRGQPSASVSKWLLWATIASLGVLPWPVILPLIRGLLFPRILPDLDVRDEDVGPAVVVLPALNEELGIQNVVKDFLSTPGVARVIVVDNGSTDRTGEIAASAGASVAWEHMQGYGHACRRALAEGLGSGYPVVILCEADGTFRGKDLEKFTAYLRHADLVLGSRTHAALVESDSQLNSFLTLGNVFVAKLLQLRYWDWRTGGRIRLTDVGCTYRAIRAEALRKILPALRVGGNHFGPHMVMVAVEHGLRVIEVPVTFSRRFGTSKGGNSSWRAAFALGVVMIYHILTYRLATGRRSSEASSTDLRRVRS